MTDNRHAGVEMAKLILAVEEARKKDEQFERRLKENIEKAEQEWEKLSDEEKAEKEKIGLGFSKNEHKPILKWTRAIRRKLRYKIFRIREGKWKDDSELASLKSWYEKQFHYGWSFNDFTFKWDISALEPLKVITPFEWDGNIINTKNGEGIVNDKFCDPAAFTNQE